MIERFHTWNRMSQVVVHDKTAYVAGQVAKKAPYGTIKEQTHAVLARIEELLEEVGTDKTKILSATIWLCSMDDFGEMNEVWDSWVAGGIGPARACVESPRLGGPEWNIEISLIAAI